MGEGSDRVNGNGSRPVHEVERDIHGLRGDIGRLVDELDRRRHEALDVRLQVRRHPLVAAALVGGVAFLVGGAIAVAVRRRSRMRTTRERARNVRRALGRMARHPDEFARDPGMLEKIAVAVATAAASMVVRRALDRSMGRPAQH
jgi:hypothetical protein